MLFAFDMFGTLADTGSVAGELAAVCAGRAAEVALAWRRKQLEYMFRVTAMGQFTPFADLTRWSLVGALAESGFSVPEAQTEQLAGAYRRLQPFDDVRHSLGVLHERGDSIVVFSVGPRAWLEELTGTYRDFVDGIVSAEEVGAYKPHPAIYRHLLATTKTEPAAALMVSANPFDIIGAATVGIRTAWCRRDPSTIFDPWGPRPDHVVTGLAGLADLLQPPG